MRACHESRSSRHLLQIGNAHSERKSEEDKPGQTLLNVAPHFRKRGQREVGRERDMLAIDSTFSCSGTFLGDCIRHVDF